MCSLSQWLVGDGACWMQPSPTHNYQQWINKTKKNYSSYGMLTKSFIWKDTCRKNIWLEFSHGFWLAFPRTPYGRKVAMFNSTMLDRGGPVTIILKIVCLYVCIFEINGEIYLYIHISYMYKLLICINYYLMFFRFQHLPVP